jgi:hypothetical protein
VALLSWRIPEDGGGRFTHLLAHSVPAAHLLTRLVLL